MMDGSTYDGEWKHGLRDGFGTANYRTGDIYKGEWSQGMKHGKGQWIRKNGETITGTFEYNKASGLCVVKRKDVQELIVFKKGIRVEKDDTKGLTCQDACMALVGTIMFLVTFIAGPFYMAQLSKDKFADGNDLNILIVLGIVWLIHLCSGQFCNESAAYLQNMQDFLEAMGNINMGIKSPPKW